MLDLKSRLSSRSFWISLAALIPLSLQAFGDITILPGNYDEIVTCFLALITAMGVINNPTTDNKWFGDDLKK